MRPGRSHDGGDPSKPWGVMPQVMTGEDITRSLRRMSHEITETHDTLDRVVLVGIHTRGVFLARRIGQFLSRLGARDIPVGELDIGLYRDDRDQREETPPKPTLIPAEISGANLVVVDDVLYTGRTVRAALDALADIGRATTVDLAVLVDRGHRELPIRADFVGRNLPTSQDETVRVRLSEVDDTDGVWIESVAAA